MVTTKSRTAILYARISSDREGREVGVDTQLRECRRTAESLGIEAEQLIEITDNDASVYRRKNRKGWGEVQQLIRKGGSAYLIVWHLDRMFRHPTDLEELLLLVQQYKVVVHSVTAGDLRLNTNEGQLAARIVVDVARYEVDHKAARQALRHKAIAEAGEWSGGKRPLGYERTGKRELGIHEQEAEVLREAAGRILRNQSLAETSRWVSGQLGRHVAPRTLRGALTKPTIAGKREYFPQKEREAWAVRRAAEGVSGDFPDELHYRPAKWPAVLDERTWRAVRALLLSPDRRASAARPKDSLLRGVLRCCMPRPASEGGTADGVCGHKLGYSRTTYKCMQGSGGCGRLAISTPRIERLVSEWAEAALEDADVSYRLSAEPAIDIHAVEAECAKVDRLIEEQLELHSSSQVSMQHLKRSLAKLYDRLDQLTEQLHQARLSETQEKRRLDVLRTATWDAADQDARREIIRGLFEYIDIMPNPKGQSGGPRFDESRVQPRWRA